MVLACDCIYNVECLNDLFAMPLVMLRHAVESRFVVINCMGRVLTSEWDILRWEIADQAERNALVLCPAESERATEECRAIAARLCDAANELTDLNMRAMVFRRIGY